MTFDEMCEFDVLYNAFLAARRGKRSTGGIWMTSTSSMRTRSISGTA